MNDLFRSAVDRDEFQRWLGLGTAPFTIWQGEKAVVTLSRLEKNPSVDYLYRIGVGQDNSISWDSSMLFCGVYDREHRTLYLTKDSLRILMDGKLPLVTEAGPSMAGEISGRINQCVEEAVANDRNNLPVQEVTGWQAVRELKDYQEYGAREEALRRFFDGREPDGRFHSDYTLDELPEAAFIAYMQDPEGFIQTEAEMHIKNNQEKFLLQFLKNDALLAEYQALAQDTGSPIHRMKAITDAVKGCGAKTVTVTVQKDGQEFTFKTSAASLTGHRNYYNTSDIPASDRKEFERLFGRYADYNAEDVVKITYGRNTIYEALPAPAEEMGPVMQMGGECEWNGYRKAGWNFCASNIRWAAGLSSER